jgi:hypothetical protein
LCVAQITSLDSDADIMRHDVREAYVAKHVTELRRKVPEMRNACLVVIAERNYGGSADASEYEFIIRPLGRMVMMKELRNKSMLDQKYGVWTTEDVKRTGSLYMSRLLRFENVAFHENLVCPGSQFKGDRNKAISVTLKQIRNLQDEGRAPKDATWGKFTRKISGKSAGKDDVMIAILLLCYWSRVFDMNTEYATIRNDPYRLPMNRIVSAADAVSS